MVQITNTDAKKITKKTSKKRQNSYSLPLIIRLQTKPQKQNLRTLRVWALLPLLGLPRPKKPPLQSLFFRREKAPALVVQWDFYGFIPFKTKLHRHRPQIAFPKKQSAFFEHSESNNFYCEFASVHLPLVPEETKSLREKTGRKGGSGSQEQLRMEIMKGDKLRSWPLAGGRWIGEAGPWPVAGGWKRNKSIVVQNMKGDKLGRQGGSGSEEQHRSDHEGGQAWETRRQRQRRAAQI